MIQKRWGFLAFVLLIGCGGSQAPRSTTPTGEETARSAAERTRKLQKEDKTGAIYATSAAEATPAKAETDVNKLPVAKPPGEVIIAVANDGSLRLGDAPTTIDAVKAKFLELAENDPHATVRIRSSVETEDAAIVELVDAAKAAGLDRFVVERPQPDGSWAPPSKSPDGLSAPSEPPATPDGKAE